MSAADLITLAEADLGKVQMFRALWRTLAYFYNGEFLTVHPTGAEKLLEMLKPRSIGNEVQ